MSGISATDMAFEGLRLVRERPRAVLVWAAILLLLSIVSSLTMVSLGGEAMAAVLEAQRAAEPDPQALIAAMRGLGPAYALLMPIVLLVYSVLYTAIYRVVLRPTDGGIGFVRLGGDELRQALVLLLYFLLMALVYFVAAFAGSIVGVVLGLAATPLLGAVGGVLVGFIFVAIVLGGVLFVGVRLSLCTPMTFVDRRLRLFESWRLTRGRFWPLLGGYVLMAVLVVVITLLGLSIFAALVAVFGGGLSALGRLFSPDFSSIGAYYSPIVLIALPFNAALGALGLALSAGAAAEAYRQIVPATPGAAAEALV